MTKYKFFFLFEKENVKKDFFWGISLRKGIQYFLSICYIYLITFLAFGLISHVNKLEIITKFFVFTILDFFSFNYFLKSTNTFSYKHAYLGLKYLNFSIILHFVYFIAKFFIFLNFHVKIYFLHFSFFSFSDHSEYYELFYLFLQMYFYCVGFNYTVQLTQGNDALVDGQDFDKYVENFGMNKSDIRSNMSENSVNKRNSSNRNNDIIERNKNKNIYLPNIDRNYINSDNSEMFG